MEKISDQEKLKPRMGIVLFVLSVLFLMTAGSTVQLKLGLFGVIITEIILLLIALGFCKLRKVRICEVLPVKKISVTDVLGVLFMTCGAYLLTTALNFISLLLMPGQVAICNALNEFLGDTSNLAVLFLAIVISAPICEEIFMRGAFLSCFRGLKKDWLVCLIVGIAFGLFHIYPFRYAGMTCLGAMLAYIMVKKNNILLPIIMHMLNNSIAFFQSAKAGNTSTTISMESILAFNDIKMLIGSNLISIALAVVFISLGVIILNKDARKSRTFVVAGATSAFFFFAGAGLNAISVKAGMDGGMPENMLLNWNYEYTVGDEFYDCLNLAECNINLEEDQHYEFSVLASAADTDVTFSIYNEAKEIVYTNTSNNLLSISEDLNPGPGTYTMEFKATDDIIGKDFQYKVLVYRN